MARIQKYKTYEHSQFITKKAMSYIQMVLTRARRMLDCLQLTGTFEQFDIIGEVVIQFDSLVKTLIIGTALIPTD